VELREDFAALSEAGVDHVVLRFTAAARRGGREAVCDELAALAPVVADLA
jgi:hypothetical protein